MYRIWMQGRFYKPDPLNPIPPPHILNPPLEKESE